MKKWNPQVKPPALTCPQQYCFHYAAKNSYHAEGFYDSLQDALDNSKLILKATCACNPFFGICIRDDPAGDGDKYEPHEPALFNAGLPWFYFIPYPPKVSTEPDPHCGYYYIKLRKKYLKKSTLLWGKDHWKNKSD